MSFVLSSEATRTQQHDITLQKYHKYLYRKTLMVIPEGLLIP